MIKFIKKIDIESVSFIGYILLLVFIAIFCSKILSNTKMILFVVSPMVGFGCGIYLLITKKIKKILHFLLISILGTVMVGITLFIFFQMIYCTYISHSSCGIFTPFYR